MSYHCKCQCDSFLEHARGINIAPSATPTRSNAAVNNAREEQMQKDLPAYRRLRDEGLQPPHVGGSAALERDATDPIEVNTGRVYGEKLPLVKEWSSALAASKAGGQ